MKIGNIPLDNPTVFAPLAGITNLPMRLLAKKAGCALVCSEMISANGLVHGAFKTRRLLDSAPAEKPLSVQIFGGDAAVLAEAAAQVEAAGADVVDINFGCAVKKILKSGSGAALMRDPQKAETLLKTLRRTIRIPLTIKMRSGWDPSGDQALKLACIAQDCGVDAVAVHPRTARQGFTGKADWSLIGRIKQVLHIPVIGNGDIVTPQDALRMIVQTGCDAVMVGRAAIGNPFIFSQIRAVLSGRPPKPIQVAERIALMMQYVAASVRYLGETQACLILRSRLGWFAKGLPQAGHFRQSIRFISSEQQAKELIQTYAAKLVPLPAGGVTELFFNADK